MLSHFRFEEVVVFPAFIIGENTYGNSLMLLGLQKEQGVLEQQFESLVQEVKNIISSGGALDEQTIYEIKKFIDLLAVHAKREMVDLYPAMNESAKSNAMFKIYIKEMNKA